MPASGDRSRDDDVARVAERDDDAPHDVDPSEAFAALGDPARIDIVRALADAQRADGEPTRYTTLREVAGIEDSGRFRYHLDRLRGTFVEQSDGGYTLTYAGARVVDAIVAGTFTRREHLGPVELEEPCRRCGDPVRAVYDDGLLTVDCARDHVLFVWSLPPRAAAGAELEELVDLATTLAAQSFELVLEGTCSECFSAVQPDLATSDDESTGRDVRQAVDCAACGASWDVPVGFVLQTHPTVREVCWRHDRPVGETAWWEHDLCSETTTIDRNDDGTPLARLRTDLGAATLRATVHEDGTVTEVRVDD